MEVSRSQVSILTSDWLLNVDGLYVCSVGLSGVTTAGGTISDGAITLISSTLPDDTMDVLLKVKQPFAAENMSGVVAVLNARGPMGAVYV